MFPKTAFDGTSKQAAKNHWLEFQKNMAYQKQPQLINPDDPNRVAEVKQMFRFTLSDNALGWYDAGNDNWNSSDQIQ